MRSVGMVGRSYRLAMPFKANGSIMGVLQTWQTG
jgi:hypothetical protein